MRISKGRMLAAAILCSVAATVAAWSGPLAAASGALHSKAAATVPVNDTSHSK